MKPEVLKSVGQSITTLPDDFTAHKGIQRVYDARRKMIETGEGVDWATAEALAFGTLLVEGTVFTYSSPTNVQNSVVLLLLLQSQRYIIIKNISHKS